MVGADDSPQMLSDSKYGARIGKITAFVVAIGIVVAGVLGFIGQQGFISPARRWLLVLDGALVIVSSVITALAKYKFKSEEGQKTLFQVLLASIAATVVLFAWVVLTEGGPDLPEGGFVGGNLAANQSVLHRFETDPGDTAVLRIRKLDGLDARAFVTNGEQELPVSGPPEGGPLELSKVLVGGLWTLQIDSINDSEGSYRVDYDVVDRPRQLNPGTALVGERVSLVSSENGYLIVPTEDLDVTVDLEPSQSDLALTSTLYRGSRTEVTNVSTGDTAISVSLRGGATYVLVVRGDGTSGAYRIAMTAPSDFEPTVPTTQAPGTEIRIPNLYGLTEAEAYEALANENLIGDSIRVCSGSISEGQVRQAFIVDSEGQEHIVGDEPGAPIDTEVAGPEQVVYMKISTGEPCG